MSLHLRRILHAAGRIQLAAVTVGCIVLTDALGSDPVQMEAEQDASTMKITEAYVPLSAYASHEVAEAVAELAKAPPPPPPGAGVDAIRAYNGEIERKRLEETRLFFSTLTRRETIAGVNVDVVLPEGEVSKTNQNRVLISLHAGGFMWGAGDGAIAEASPIAASMRIKVIAIDYRMAPEHMFPAATEDVAAVYGALLKEYEPENIGLFGCSAGGILAAQSVVWFAQHDLPKPGAIVTSCATGAEVKGDSAYLAPMLTGAPVPPGGKPLMLSDLPYFVGVDPGDPMAFPIESPSALAEFPPTLLIAGSRDFSASSLTVMHRRLRDAGAKAELYLFDGLWHAFLLSPKLPESREAYRIIARFFDEHLGSSAVSGDSAREG